ncbi:MAG: S1 RNA-binding domain-containing protein [Candidatus Shikimatogenerans bostrichidophilus]|nr:MAG: S1 RNA-binding domain-containing protein [Candidatus Shikimatogenerans bostrichidophilus]
MNYLKKKYNSKILKKHFNKIFKKKIYKIPEINKYDIYKGRIINILEDYVVIDFGHKFEGIVPINEFKKEKIKINDKKDIMIVNTNYNGNCLLSYKKALNNKSWINIQKIYESKNNIKGYILYRTKGGYIVSLYKDITCFLPGSQIKVNAIKDYDYYIGKIIDLQIIKINLKIQNIIVSHKVIMDNNIENNKKKFIDSLEVGKIIEGKVKNIISYGVFIDLGYIDGLLHITDISWKKKVTPRSVFKLGKRYKFIIIGIDKEKSRVQLGYKQLTTNPWDILINKIKIGKVIRGRVTAVTDYGAFIELLEGIEGLLHVSEMSWDHELKTAKDLIKINQLIKCIVINIDKDDKKVYLSLKRFKKDPFEEIIKKYSIGKKYTGIIDKILKYNYGLRIKLEKNLYGILLNNDISWYKRIYNLSKYYKIGDKIDVTILSINLKTKKIILGHKQLYSNKWDEYKKIFKPKSVHKGTITKITKNSIILNNKINKDLKFFIYNKFLKNNTYNIGDEIKFFVIDVNNKYKKIYVKPYNIKDKKIILETSTFGDLDELNIIKKKIEKEENKNK